MPSTIASGVWPFVAREHELALAEAALQEEGCAGIVIAGAAGVGKSRLAAEIGSRAAARGCAHLHITATRGAREVPLAPLAALLPASPMSLPQVADPIRDAVKALARRASGSGLVVTVDDAHLLDDFSALVLHALASRADAHLIATVRTGEVAPDAVVALWKDGGATRLELDAFSRPESDALVQALLGEVVDGALYHQVFERSKGNALLVCELVRGGVEAGLLDDATGVWRATSSLRPSTRLIELLADRLSAIPDPARHALALVALGEPLELRRLTQLVDPASVDRLERAGVISITTDEAEAIVGLRHPLFGDVVRDGLTHLQERDLLMLLADAHADSDRPGDLVRTVAWRLQSGAERDPARLLTAAQRAYFGRSDPGLAESMARAALESGATPDSRLLLGELLVVEGRHSEAVEVIEGVRPDNDTDAARAELLRAQALFRSDGPRAAVDDALAHVESLDAGSWNEVAVAQGAVFDILAGEPRRALEQARPLLASDDERVLAHATLAVAVALALVGRCDEAVEVAARGTAAQDALLDRGEAAGLGLHLVARALALTEAGHLDEAIDTCRSGYERAVDRAAEIDQGWFALLHGRALGLAGRMEAARHLFVEAEAIFDALGQEVPRRWAIAGGVYAAASTGSAEVDLDRLTAPTSSPMRLAEPDVLRARGWGCMRRGDPTAAQGCFVEAARIARSMGAYTLEAGALHELVRVGGRRSKPLQIAVERLIEIVDRVDGPLTEARALHARGLLQADPDALEAAAAVFADCGAHLFAAEAAAGAAGAHEAKGSPRAADRARARASALAARCEDAATPALATAGPAGALTDREREVATLAASNLSNREIAQRLHISRRTVGNHLYRAFTKLGVTGRDELAAALRIPPAPR